MAEQIMWWGIAINVVLLTRVILRAPEAIRLHAEAAYLSEQAGLLRAQTEQAKFEKGLSQEQYMRDMREGYEAKVELEKLKQAPQQENPPCDTSVLS